MRSLLSFVFAFALLPLAAWAEMRLLMAEQPGCHYCARWLSEIGPIYPKTSAGKAAPLQRFQISDGAPDGVALSHKVVFTPTFILVKNAQEVARIEGYPGEDFFWGLVEKMINDANQPVESSG